MGLLLADFPETVPGVTVNRLCGSGLEAIAQAARTIALGDAELMIGGGVESMSRAPWVVPKSERPFATGPMTMADTSLGWRLVNPRMEALGHTDPLGITAETLAEEFRISRERQDAFALASQAKARAAIESGRLAQEIVPVDVKVSRDAQLRFGADEAPRETTAEKLASLRAAFKTGGTVTAGNSSPLNDGAAAVLLASADWARRHGIRPMAVIRGSASAGVAPRVMGLGPVPATEKLLRRLDVALDDIDHIELNEAFAAQSLAVLQRWGVADDDPRVNPNGGAIALGHPLGCSGARLVTTIAHQLSRRDNPALALATMCIGVGQGVSMLLGSA